MAYSPLVAKDGEAYGSLGSSISQATESDGSTRFGGHTAFFRVG